MEVYVNCLILIYTREQFEIEEDTEFERHWPRARASCIVDVNSWFDFNI